MSPIIRFADDDSLWRYFGYMECEWQDISSQSPYRQHHYALINRKNHWYIDKDVNLEIDAVLAREQGMFASRQDTLTTIVYLDSALVGLTRATSGIYGLAISGFTYVRAGSVVLAISTPAFDDLLWEPLIEIWIPPRPLSLQESHYGLGLPWGEEGSDFEQLAKSHSLTVEGKILGEDGTWLEKVQSVSKFGDPEDANLLACDGELLAEPWHGNPRDIRRRILGLPVDPEGWCPDPYVFFGKDSEERY